MAKKNIILISIFLISLLAVSAVSADSAFSRNDDSMHQVSTMQSFMHGAYEGIVSVGELKYNGDTGIGTFDGADGEMIVLDWVVYQVKADGSINVMPNNETIPFAVITYFDKDAELNGISAKNIDDLTSQLNSEVEKLGKNNMYVVKIKCYCHNITVRSVEKQNQPYKEFNEVAKTDQKVFNYTNESGTIVGVYFPEHMGDLNMAGWHLHFLNDAKDKGGHVLGLNITNGTADYDEMHEFNVIFPTTDRFAKMNFTEDMSNKISSVE